MLQVWRGEAVAAPVWRWVLHLHDGGGLRDIHPLLHLQRTVLFVQAPAQVPGQLLDLRRTGHDNGLLRGYYSLYLQVRNFLPVGFEDFI